MKKAIVLFIMLRINIGVSFCQTSYEACILKLSKQQVISELGRYSQYWLKDSLANNGFRRFIGREYLRCSASELEGTKWSHISSYLGQPHFTLKSPDNPIYSNDEVKHRYVLYTYGDYRNYKDIGNILLDIIVIQDVIKKISVYEIDG